MDSQIKSGKVYLRPLKAGKKWKPVLLSLFPPSSSGVGRLEIQDMGGGSAGGDHSTGVRRPHQPQGDRKVKVVRLSELLSVLRLPPNAEACPMDNMSAFCVETQDRTMVFAALKDECVDWVEKLCQSTFQKGSHSHAAQLHMEENQIYASVGEVPEFRVVIQRTDAATRCGLQGAYWLQVGREALQLREIQKKNIIHEWPYELLRRYGKDNLLLTIEAGRRCSSGPGTFSFETQQAGMIFSMIQSSIKHKSSSATLGTQGQEEEKVTVTNIQAHSPLPKIPDMSSMAAILENKLRLEERNDESQRGPEGLVGESEGAAHPAPITLMPLPLVPKHGSSSAGNHGGQSEAIYADPTDCIQAVLKPQPTTAMYVDPAKVLPLKPPGSRLPAASAAPHPGPGTDDLDSVYSEVYDKVSPDQNKQGVLQSKGETKRLAQEGAVYTEPVRAKHQVSSKRETKPDPFAHLYAQVHKKAPSPSPSSSPNSTPSTSSSLNASASMTQATDESLDDVIYENLGII